MSEKFVKVHFYGSLKKLSKEPVILSGNTAAEIISGLKRMFPELNPTIKRRPLVKIKGYEDEKSLFAPLHTDELHIMPAVIGGKGGFFNVVLGAVLVAVAYAIPVIGMPIGYAIAAQLALGMGVSMILGGLIQMLSPAPSLGNSNEEQTSSQYIPSQTNTVRIGTRIALFYGGPLRVPVHVLSINVDAVDVVE